MAHKTREEIRADIQKLGDKIPGKYREVVEDAIVDMYENDLTPQEALHITPQMMDLMYGQAYQLFQSGKYQDALNVFFVLRSLNPNSYTYSFAMASCYQYLKEYENAIGNYMLCNLIDFYNPIPHFHSFDCFMKLNNPIGSLKELVLTIMLADRDPKYSELKARATLELENLKKDIRNGPLNK